MDYLTNLFMISFKTLNIFSFILGMMAGLSTGAFDRHKPWLVVVAYFMGVAGYYALISGAFFK